MIEIEQARELLAKAVETQGRNFVYNPDGSGDCKYEPISVLEAGGDPDDPRTKTGCLIGVVLEMVGESRHRGSVSTIANLADRELSGLMSRETIQYFTIAQGAQDNGRTWGEAYDRAETYRRACQAR